jgi:hypothetical protein
MVSFDDYVYVGGFFGTGLEAEALPAFYLIEPGAPGRELAG